MQVVILRPLSCPWIPTSTICRWLLEDTFSILSMAPYSYHIQVVIVRHLLYPVLSSLFLPYAGGYFKTSVLPLDPYFYHMQAVIVRHLLYPAHGSYSYHMQVVILRHLLCPAHGSLLLPYAGCYFKTSVLPMDPYFYHMQVVILRHLLCHFHGSLLLPYAGGYCKTPSLSCPWLPTRTKGRWLL
jgi:hypothetical protein